MMGHGNSLRGPPLLSTLSIDNRIDTYPVKATSQAVMSYTTIQMIQVQVRSGRCRIYSRNCLQYIHIIQLFSSASILPLRLVLRRCQSARGDANHNKKKMDACKRTWYRTKQQGEETQLQSALPTNRIPALHADQPVRERHLSVRPMVTLLE